MDPLEVLPPEVGLRVLELLEPADLCRCLAVSSRWRQLANSEPLWRKVCRQRHLELSPDPGGGQMPLCSWAQTYIGHMSRLVKNWRTDSFQSYKISKEDWCCSIACHNSMVAVYYPRESMACLYHLDFGLEPLYVPVLLPPSPAIPDIFLSERYLLICSGNAVLVYRSGGDFALLKSVVHLGEGRLALGDGIQDFLQTDRRLYVKLVAGDTVWLESDSVFVVDILTNSCRVLGDTYRCLRFDGNHVMAANDQVTAFSPSGDVLYRLDIRRVADMWLGADLLAVLLGSDSQRVEVWRRSSRTKLSSLPVEKDPCVHFGADHLYLLEFGEGLLSLSRVALEGLRLVWRYCQPFPRELSVHPELRLICGRFAFLRPSHTADERFQLIDCKSGQLIYEKDMPPCLSPPCYIYHLSDEIFITAESNHIHIRRYT